ncbi:MAG TPA: MFS transporter [Acidimicrobiales bacterium]|nr:MFS transporter [Acidimicrobiales bacterium]
MPAVTASFVLFGVFWGSWAVSAADVERSLDLSHARFGLLLSVGLGGAAIANGIGGALTERFGTGRVLSAAMAAWGVLLLGGSAVATVAVPWAFCVALVGAIAVGGVVDVVMNVAAIAALADDPGGLVRFHARFNIGAAVGALGTGILLGAAVTWRWAWLVAGILALVLAAWCHRTTLPGGEGGERVPVFDTVPLLRREHLVVVAVAFAVAGMVEGGVELWGVLFLRTFLHSGLPIAVGSAVGGYSVATIARVVFGPAAGRHGAATGVTIGASAAAVGVLVLGLASVAWVSGLGLVVAAGGISMCWPLLLAHASEGRARPAATVGSVTAVGYLGFVAGPSVVGWISAAFGLRAGLLLLAVAASFVALVPRVSSVGRAPAAS